MTTAQLVRVRGEAVGAPADGVTGGWAGVEAPGSSPRPAGPVSTPDDPGRRRQRVVAAALACVAEHGLKATTADDIARRAGCSRATVYRVFPGGRDAVLGAVADAEVERCLAEVAAALTGADTLADALVAGITVAGRFVGGHPVLSRLLAEEPDVVLPLLAFEHEERILLFVARWAAPYLGRWLDPVTAARVAEWAVRVVDAYGLDPVSAPRLADQAWVRRLVTTTMLPGAQAMARAAGHPVPTSPTDPPGGTDNKGAPR